MIKVSLWRRDGSPYWYLRWFEPLSGKEFKVSTKTTDRRAAERLAIKKEAELESIGSIAEITWDKFRAMFEEQHLLQKSKPTIENFTFALNRFERDIGSPKRLRDITPQVLSQWSAKMSKQIKPTSVASNLRVMRATLGWAHKMGMIHFVPPVSMPKSTANRGRGISQAELNSLIAAIRANDSPEIANPLAELIEGLWLSGLRLEEALQLSIDQFAPVQLDLDRPRPMFIFREQKNQKYEEIPTTPDFADFAKKLGRTAGKVFPITFAKSTIGKRISDAGKKAGISVSKTKHASAHDLRRSFGERWALILHPVVLKTIMRHSSIETTLRHYVRLDSDNLAATIWNAIPLTVPPTVPESSDENSAAK